MPLTACRECKGQVATTAPACPRCGALPGQAEQQLASTVKLSVIARSRPFAGAVFFLGLAWMGFAVMTSDEAGLREAFKPAIYLVAGGAIWYIIAEIERNLEERRAKRDALP